MSNRAQVLLMASDERDRTLVNRHKKIGVFLAPPFGLYRMKVYLEAKGLADVDVFDPNLYPKDMEQVLSKMINSKQYDVIGFSPTHINLESDMRIITNVKIST